MSGHKPRRVRWAKSPDTILIAMHRASKPDASNVQEIHAAMQASFKALREGVATELQWSILAGSLDVSKAIERQGVVRGLSEHLASAEQALQAIYNRARMSDGWHPPVLHFHELDAIREFVDLLYAYQLRQLSRGEFLAAINSAKGKIRSYSDHSVSVQPACTS